MTLRNVTVYLFFEFFPQTQPKGPNRTKALRRRVNDCTGAFLLREWLHRGVFTTPTNITTPSPLLPRGSRLYKDWN